MTEIEVDIRDWYFAVVDRVDVWSTRCGAWGPSGDADYLAWRARWGADPIALPSEAELDATLRRAGLPGPDLVAYANARQWALALGGRVVDVGGTRIGFRTDTESQALMVGKAFRLSLPGAPATVRWQTGPAEFVVLDSADFIAAATTVADWVQATFDALDDVIFPGIAAGTITTTAEIDAVFAAI